MPHAEAVAIIEAARGSHFDPDVADAFLAIDGQFQAIARSYADSDVDLQRKDYYVRMAISL